MPLFYTSPGRSCLCVVQAGGGRPRAVLWGGEPGVFMANPAWTPLLTGGVLVLAKIVGRKVRYCMWPSWVALSLYEVGSRLGRGASPTHKTGWLWLRRCDDPFGMGGRDASGLKALDVSSMSMCTCPSSAERNCVRAHNPLKLRLLLLRCLRRPSRDARGWTRPCQRNRSRDWFVKS